MEHYGSITTPVSVPRLIVGAMLAAGVAVLIMAFTKYGLLAGLAVSVIPAALCILWVTLRNPAISMLGLFVVNYFIMTLTRYAYDLPFGMILDALIFYNFLIITLQALMRPIEWKRASSGLTVVAAIWMAYCILEIVNPESVSVAGWFSSVRSIAFYFFFIVVLPQLTMTEYKYLKYMLAVWSVLTLIAVGKACMQKFFGFNAAENYWLFVLGGRSTHIIHSGVRYFSFFSDAANFGGSMGLSMVVFSISALYYRNSWMKLYLLLVAAAACYGMLISGTRSALAVPFVGYSAFIMMSRNIKMIGAGVFLIIAAFIFLKFTTIGQGNSIIRRARSAFNTNDPSFQVRLANQAKLRELMADKPFGAGLGHGGGKAKTFAPNAALSQIPTDSWFVMVWVETGVVGILLHIGILLYILARGAYLVIFKLRNTQLRGFTAALTAGISGIVVMAYANEILGQIPTGAILYMSMGFIFLAPRFDANWRARRYWTGRCPHNGHTQGKITNSMKPLISVISVNYNGYALTCAMVESLRRHVTSPLEIIVVDNGSARDEAAMLRERYPEIKALRSERNLGFAGGNNLGLAAATGDYLLLLNNDTEVEDDTLHYLCETLAGNPAIGAVCPKIRFFAPPRHIQFAGYTPLTHVTLRNALIGFGMPDDGSFDTPRDTPYAHGAAMMVRREVPRKAGPMPDIYFLYYEELDWSVRIREQGWKIAYDPRCTVFHKESATSGQQSPLRSYYLTRNRLLFAWRNLHGTARMLSVAYQLCIAVPKSIAAALAHGRRDLAKAIRHGAGGFFTLKNKTA